MKLNDHDIKALGFFWIPLEYEIDSNGASLYCGYYKYPCNGFSLEVNYTEETTARGDKTITYNVELILQQDALRLPHIDNMEDLRQFKALITGRYIRWYVHPPVSFPNRMINLFKNMVLPS